MKKLLFGIIGLFILGACSSGSENGSEASSAADKYKVETKEVSDDGKGVGEITSVSLNSPLDPKMIENGKGIYELKCAACHKLNDQRVVGPGWKGITESRKPEWIMNMITNVDVMLKEDAAAQELLKKCLVRMPNQNITLEDSRDILEFMFSNDGLEVGS
jgi:cytochrome c